MRTKFITILFLLYTVLIYGQAPVIRCLEVAESGGLTTSGDVTVRWTPPADLTDVVGYNIYFSENETGPFQHIEVGLVDNDKVELIDNGLLHDANDQSIFFKMATRYNDGSLSNETNIVQTIFVRDTEAVPNPDDQTIFLGWNNTKITSPALFSIYRKNKLNPWEEIVTNISAEEISDYIPFCAPTTRYRIKEQGDACYSISNTFSTQETDHTKPDIQQLNYISVSLTGKIQLGWNPSTADDLEEYKIFQQTTGINYYATIPGDNTSYITNDAIGYDSPVSFFIIAVDKCGNGSANEEIEYLHTTIWLKDIVYSECEKHNTISFTPYIRDHNKAVEYYSIQRKNNTGSTYYEIAQQNDNTDYIDDDIELGNTYYYRIVAHWNDNKTAFSSSSCIKQITTTIIPKPDFVYTQSVSVNNNEIDISAYFDNSVDITNLNIYRRTTMDTSWDYISTMNINGAYATYTDIDVNTESTSYYYKIVPTNKCDNETVAITENNISKTILLSLYSTTEGDSHLSWTNYEGWEVKEFEIYRFQEGETPQLITTVDANVFEYNDSPINTGAYSGQWHYQIKAIEDNSNIHALTNLESLSNIAITSLSTEMFLPNAFAPRGTNYEFKPIGKNISNAGYSMEIYNRWGQKIFRSSDASVGWNGDFNGEHSPKGTYAYIIKYINTNGEVIHKTGTVILIR